MREEGKIIAEPHLYGRKPPRQATRPPVPARSKHSLMVKWSFGLLMISCLVWAWVKIINPATFPVRTVQIKGNYSHVDRELLRQTIMPYVKSGLFEMDTNSLRDRLSQIPWVANAAIDRQWPDALTISLVEQQPVARIGNDALLNAQGEVFAVNSSTIPQKLPLFTGPSGQEKLMLETYQQMELLLSSLGLHISSLSLDERQAWLLQLNNGLMVEVGHVDPLARLQRFVSVYNKMVGSNLANIQLIDLRYGNGAAVQFKQLSVNKINAIN